MQSISQTFKRLRHALFIHCLPENATVFARDWMDGKWMGPSSRQKQRDYAVVDNAAMLGKMDGNSMFRIKEVREPDETSQNALTQKLNAQTWIFAI
jgi:hypothetical protein